jgi:hypothetical protein
VIGLGLMRVQFGWPIGMPLVRSLKDGPWEVRSTLPSQRIARLILCFHMRTLVVLHGFIRRRGSAGRRSCTCEATDERGNHLKKKNRHIDSSLDEFLKEEGILEETCAAALKEAIAWQVQKAMKRAKSTRCRWRVA